MTGFDRPESEVLSLRGDLIGWVIRTPSGSGFVAYGLDRVPVSGEVHPTIDAASRELRLLRLAALPPAPDPPASRPARALSPRSRGLMRLKTERPENRTPKIPDVERMPYRD